MIKKIRQLLGITCFMLISILFQQANASIVSYTEVYEIDSVNDFRGVLTGLVSVGDLLYIQAYYDSEAATLIANAPNSNNRKYYSLPGGSAGVIFSINGNTWSANGPMTIALNANAGSTDFDSLAWLADTNPANNYWVQSTNMTSPVPISNTTRLYLNYSLAFDDGALDSSLLPSSLDGLPVATDDTRGQGFAYQQGIDANGNPASYRFNYSLAGSETTTPQVPLPASVWLFGSGLLGLIGMVRRKRT